MNDTDTKPDQDILLTSSPAPEPQGDEECPYCHGVGAIRLDVPVGHRLFGKAVPCRCKRQSIQQKRLAQLRKISNLEHLQHMTFDAFRTDPYESAEISWILEEALRTARSFAENPSGWLIFTGSYGSGKTHLAAALANYRVERGLPVLFVVAPDLLDHLRATYAPESPVTYDERFQQVRDVEVLVLDDLGTQNTTPWAAEKLYQLLNYRYNAALPTVITTNQSLEDIDPRLGSRFRDQNLVRKIPMYTPDFRTKIMGENVTGKGETFGGLSLYEELTFTSFSDRKGELEPAVQARLRETVRQIEEYAESPMNWLLLRGPYGVGKTHLAAAAANKVMRSGSLVLFVVVPDLLDHLRATFQPGSSISYDQRFNEVRRARFLVLDDMGTQNTTQWAQEKLFQILNYRYVARLPTIITLSSADWERLDERLKNRLLDTSVCTILDLEIPSYRGAMEPPKAPRRTTRRRL